MKEYKYDPRNFEIDDSQGKYRLCIDTTFRYHESPTLYYFHSKLLHLCIKKKGDRNDVELHRTNIFQRRNFYLGELHARRKNYG